MTPNSRNHGDIPTSPDLAAVLEIFGMALVTERIRERLARDVTSRQAATTRAGRSHGGVGTIPGRLNVNNPAGHSVFAGKTLQENQ